MLTTENTRLAGPDFESIYSDADGNPALVPWAHDHAHPALVTWLNAVAPSLIRCGARVAVVGCGLGYDAREVIRRGYDVTAFDCSESAIDWAKRLDSECADAFSVADLFDLPPRWRHRFDLVVEINTIQAMAPDLRPEVMGSISQLLSPRGHLLVICRGADEPASMDDGPPWPLTERELRDAAGSAGLVGDGPVAVFLDAETPPVRRMRAMFTRSTV